MAKAAFRRSASKPKSNTKPQPQPKDVFSYLVGKLLARAADNYEVSDSTDLYLTWRLKYITLCVQERGHLVTVKQTADQNKLKWSFNGEEIFLTPRKSVSAVDKICADQEHDIAHGLAELLKSAPKSARLAPSP